MTQYAVMTLFVQGRVEAERYGEARLFREALAHAEVEHADFVCREALYRYESRTARDNALGMLQAALAHLGDGDGRAVWARPLAEHDYARYLAEPHWTSAESEEESESSEESSSGSGERKKRSAEELTNDETKRRKREH